VLQQARADQLGRDGLERLAVGLLLVDCAQLVQQRLEAREELAHADRLPWPAHQRLLELERPHAILRLRLFFLFLLFLLLLNVGLLLYNFNRRGSAAPAAWSHVACWRVLMGGWLCQCAESGIGRVHARRGGRSARAGRKVEARRGDDDALETIGGAVSAQA
jgi:hypothetical protein